jgi:succinate-acetate transporter protein
MAGAFKCDEEAVMGLPSSPLATTVHPINEDVQRVHTSGTNSEFIHIGNQKVLKSELLAAFGGRMNPGLLRPTHKFANPSPLGLCGFALTNFVLSIVNCQARHVTDSSIVIGLAFFYGGFIQVCAGMWEMATGNTFGATALSSYGGFWISYAAIVTDAFGVVSSYKTPSEFDAANGFYLIGWFIFTFLLLMCTVRSTISLFALYLFLDITYLLLAIGAFLNSASATKAGGVFGLITAFTAWYNAFAGIATRDNSWFTVNPVYMPGAVRLDSKSD